MVDDGPPSELLQAREHLWQILDDVLGHLPDTPLHAPAASVSLAVVVLADWIASSKTFIKHQQGSLGARSVSWDPVCHYESASRLALEHLAEYGLIAPTRRCHASAEALFGSSDARWSELQESLVSGFRPSSAGIAVVCAPTGEGKTEAGLLAAARFADVADRHGFFFAMPTVATAEGLHERLDQYLRSVSPPDDNQVLRRVHSQSILYDSDPVPVSDDPEAVRAAAGWMTGTRKTLLSPYGVGTVDQVLLGAMRAKHSPLRLFAAALGTLVVDEAHALDPYMRMLLARAVEWLAALGAPVVILSATMPPKRVAELVRAYQTGAERLAEPMPAPEVSDSASTDDMPIVGYPGWVAWTAVDGWSTAQSRPRRRWSLRFETEDVLGQATHDRMAEKAVDASRRGKCVLVVCSTVRAACNTYWAARRQDPALIPGDGIEIIHSRMPHRSRRERAQRLLETLGPDAASRPERMILVATQVVEQSFDVDFDTLVTDPAPVSALLQRAGRVRRHRVADARQPAVSQVVWPTDARGVAWTGSPIYSKADLAAARTCLTLAETTCTRRIRVPEDVPELVKLADPEDDACFDFDDSTAAEAEEATLAQLVRVDYDKAQGLKWAIPPARHDAPLAELTGALDGDDVHPGTRHKAVSVLVVPAVRSGYEWQLADGTPIEQSPSRRPPRSSIISAFDSAVPVSYPNQAWASELPRLSDGWDRTPLSGALLLDVSSGERVEAGGFGLRICGETGLLVEKLP